MTDRRSSTYRGVLRAHVGRRDADRRVRFVVLDSETTGLNPRTDRLITIGAVAVQRGDIVLEDSFSALLQVARNTAAVTVHGITRDRGRKGLDEPRGPGALPRLSADGVIVGHHIGHDIATLNAACERHWGATLLNRSLDTMDLTLHLERAGAFAGRPPIRRFTLDALCDDVRRHPARSAHGHGRCVHHRAGLPAAAAAGGDGTRETLARICEPFPIPEEA